MVDSLRSRLRRSLRSRGWCKTLKLGRERLGEILRARFDARFDRRFGTHTSGGTELSDLGIDDDAARHGIFYEPSPTRTFRSLVRQLPVDYRRTTFIDMGSGRGRVLLLAAGMPFRRVVGVEFSRVLHESALENIAACRRPRQCHDVTSVQRDAQEFQIPDGPLAIYFYTPFTGPVMERVVENIQESLAADPREVVLAYYGGDPTVVAQLDRLGWARQSPSLPRDFSRTGTKMSYFYRFPGAGVIPAAARPRRPCTQ